VKLIRPLVLVTAFVLMTGSASAQGASVAFATEPVDADQPVEVTADRLDVSQTDGTATFEGNVVVVQGELTLTAGRVLVEYGDTEPREIEQIFAFGNVVLVSPTETAEGDEAVYAVADRSVVLTGNVLLTQELNVVSGERLTIDLDTGTGVVEGRVRTILRSGSN
jgi:lipopolysaccharide export system protein LptA